MATNPHIYISSVVGTNTGASDTSKATQQTGNITSMTASDVYESIYAAVSGCTPGNGDTIYMCDNHVSSSYTEWTDILVNASGSESGTGLKIISVDSTNIDEYKPGAHEVFHSEGASFAHQGNLLIAGVDINTQITNPNKGATKLQDLTILVPASYNRGVSITSLYGASMELVNVTITTSAANTSYAVNMGTYSRFTWNGGALATTGSGTWGALFGPYAHGSATVRGVNLEALDDAIIEGGISTQATAPTLKLVNCTLNSSMTSDFADLFRLGPLCEMYNTDDSTGDYHRFIIASGIGRAVNNDSVYVTTNKAWYGGSTKSSIFVTTNSTCNEITPFIFDFPGKRYVDLSSTSTDKITINLVSNFTLTDTDIIARMVYPDGTTVTQGNWLTSGPTVGTGNYGVDPLSAGTTLSTSSLGAADWTGEPASPNFYKIELDTSTDAGSPTAVGIRMEVRYTSIDGTTNKLYIDPIFEIGT